MEAVKSFARGLDVIRSFNDHKPRQTAAQVAMECGISRSSARRLLFTLEAEGYARQCGAEFELTPRVLDLGYSFLSSFGLSAVASPHLHQLSRAAQESVAVAVLDGVYAVYVARVAYNRVMGVQIDVGSRLEAYQTAIGRALIAWKPEGEIAEIWRQSPKKLANGKTVASLEELQEKLYRIREQGFAIVDQELELGVRAIAAPIPGATGAPVAAVNVSSQTARTSMKRLRGEFAPLVLGAAREIASSMAMSRL